MESTISIGGYIVEKKDPFFEMWFGKPDTTMYASDDFVEQTSTLKDGDTLNIDLNTDGGSIDAGVRIYNACNDLQKKGVNVITFNRGKQHSIGNVVMLGGYPRKGYQSSTGVVHLPYIPTDRLWGQMGYTAEDLETTASDLRLEEDRILDIYVKETGKDKVALRTIMEQQRNLSAKELLDLNFLTEIVDGAPKVAAENKKAFAYVNHVKTNTKTPQMDKDIKDINTKLNAFEKMLAPFVNLLKGRAVNLDLTLKEGTILHLTKESGDPAIGDEATINDLADGEGTLEDGTMVKVEAGVITELNAPEDPSELDNLKNEIAALKAENEALTAKLGTAENSLAETINQVAPMVEKFNELKNTVTGYTPTGRTTNKVVPDPKNKVDGVDFDMIKETLNRKKK